MITLYTDGSAWLEDMSGGWAWWVSDGLWNAGFVTPATNNQMEMRAVQEGLAAVAWLEEPVRVVSDSAYVVNCFLQKWYEGWRRRSRMSHRTGEVTWRNSQDKKVANQAQWEEFLTLVENYPAPITWTHCRGHGRGGPEDAPYLFGNDKVDKLAGQARKAGIERSHP